MANLTNTFSEIDSVLSGINNAGLDTVGITQAVAASSIGAKKKKTVTAPTKLIFLGASITQSVVSLSAKMQGFFASEGISISVVDFATAGNYLAGIQAEWDAGKAAYADDPSVWVFVHAGGNDVSALRPYSTATTQELDTMQKEYAKLLNSICANGNTVIPTTITFRNYSGMADDSDGSLPFNTNIVLPAIEAVAKANPYLSMDYIDMYGFTKQNYLPIGSDGVHYTSDGNNYIAKWICDNVLSIYRHGSSIREFGEYIATAGGAVAQDALLWVYDGFPSSGISTSAFPSNFIGTSSSTTDIALMSLNSNVPNPVGFELLSYTGSANNLGALDSSDNTRTLTNDFVKDNYVYVEQDAWMDVARIYGFAANQNVLLRVAGYKDDAGTNRVTEFTTDGGTTVHELDSSNNNVNYERSVSFVATADASGEITLAFRRKTGSTFGYFSGVQIIPLDAI